MNLLSLAGKMQERGESFAVATITEVKGSTPRSTGKMLVRPDGSIEGTIGGGPLEAFAIEESVRAIGQKRSSVCTYILNSDAAEGLHMQCGGQVSIFIEVIVPAPKILVVGGGHVGLAVAKLAQLLGYGVMVADDREAYACAARFPMAFQTAHDPDIEKAVAALPADSNTYAVIATKDVDLAALRAVLLTNAAYIGMIGSRRKVTKVFESLRAQGVPQERLSFVHAPVGLDIGSETPEEIAVSIVAEIMQVRAGASGKALSLNAGTQACPDRGTDDEK